jgi:hypothetical protein
VTSPAEPRIVVGPLLRYVDETSATIWVEVRRPGKVRVSAAGWDWSAPTFTVHGHHYVLVMVEGLTPGTSYPYRVSVDGETAWPLPESEFPPSRIRTLDVTKPLNILFGSCRASAPHGPPDTEKFGVDVMRAYALRMTEYPESQWPDLFAMIGDQVYADDTSDAMREFIAARRDISKPPGEELKDFAEYAKLYELSWSDPANRWLLSTVPSAMIFDDHDIRDDWNTSHTWREQMSRLPWWKDRIVGGLASYWVYQHLGNLSPAECAQDDVWKHITSTAASDPGHDYGPFLDEFADRADEHPDSYRWSYARDLGRTRLLVVDSRASRVLTPDRRSMLDDLELAWVRNALRGDVDQLLLATSLPFLLAPGLHHFEAWDEAVAEGAWGRHLMGLGERIRQGVDFEHWAAFEAGFRELAELVTEVADGRRGEPPAVTVFLSGDVHHSYLAEVVRSGEGRILQAVCSPMRNPMPRPARVGTRLAARPSFGRLVRRLARSAKVPEPPIQWTIDAGPWFENCLATLVTGDRSVRLRWETADADAGESPMRTIYESEVS